MDRVFMVKVGTKKNVLIVVGCRGIFVVCSPFLSFKRVIFCLFSGMKFMSCKFAVLRHIEKSHL